MKQHDAYAAWRLPAFRRYFAGNMILILGWQMQKVAIGWEIYERTHSAMALGYAGLMQFLPQVLFMLFAGHIVDRYNRKYALMFALIGNCVAAVGLALNAGLGGSV